MINERDWLAERFEERRSHLRPVAYRMLGALSEADDAVQEAWLRLSRAGYQGDTAKRRQVLRFRASPIGVCSTICVGNWVPFASGVG
jgi:DNA-directed RNA polymerase specialized sigma24 family protein